jgi:hypothetical protein
MQAASDFQAMAVQVLPSPRIANLSLASEVEVRIFAKRCAKFDF